MFDNKTILITGGTGSFGNACTRYLLENYDLKKLIIFSRDELKQFEMEQSFRSSKLRFFLGDVRDHDRLVQAFEGVDYVIHAAALKQVPAAEYNPMECIRTNIYGAENVIRAALERKVEKVVALSTDKAASPVNLYGATKLASDKLFVSANNMAGGHKTRFCVVRYGNVVGSRGSVVPFFRKLIAEGARSLPITHPEMTRFWITLPQGVAFVLKAFERMYGGEIFIPKIPSVRITDLAQAMAPHLKTDVVGVRPGEKIHEIMVPRDNYFHTLEFHDHYVITPTINFGFDVNYEKNRAGEKSKRVPELFEYDSLTNPHFLTVEELEQMDRQ